MVSKKGDFIFSKMFLFGLLYKIITTGNLCVLYKWRTDRRMDGQNEKLYIIHNKILVNIFPYSFANNIIWEHYQEEATSICNRLLKVFFCKIFGSKSFKFHANVGCCWPKFCGCHLKHLLRISFEWILYI